MAAPVPHRVPLAVGDQRVLFFGRSAHVVPRGRRWAPLRPPRLAAGLGGHERSDRAGRAPAPAGNGGGTAPLALRLPTMQAIV